MFEIAGGLGFDIHGVTGVMAIILVFIHAIWANIVLARKDEKAITSFHKFSVIVWAIWADSILDRLLCFHALNIFK